MGLRRGNLPLSLAREQLETLVVLADDNADLELPASVDLLHDMFLSQFKSRSHFVGLFLVHGSAVED